MWLKVEAIGDPQGLPKEPPALPKIRKNKNIDRAEYAAKVITIPPYYKEGFSFQTGTGGAALAVSLLFSAKRCLKME